MQNEFPYKSYCLDASCFSSVEKLKDTLNLLSTLKTYADGMVLNIPKQVYDIIILPPDDKFRELPTHISEWIDDEDEKRISSLDTMARQEYVRIMQTILNTFEVRHPSFISEDITEIGNESIHLKDLITKFGKKVGEILFEELASSWELKSKIICFGKKTIEFLKKFGTKVVEGRSKFKSKIKEKSKIKGALKFMMLFMSINGVQQFVRDYQIDINLPDLTTFLGFGLLIIGDG